jgi:hypothetical protein
VKNGIPIHAVRYAHSYGHIIDKNDDKTLKKMVEEKPDIMERSFTLRVPKPTRVGNTHNTIPTRSNKASPRTITHRGALARAIKAGLLSTEAAEQLGI